MPSPSARLHAPRGTREFLEAGLFAGLIGGTLMALVMMITTAARGMGALGALRMIAQTFYGSSVVSGAGPVVVGLIVHLALSLSLGLIFIGLIGERLAPPLTLLFGVIFSLTIWMLVLSFGLPIFDPLMKEQISFFPPAFFIAHLLFGIGVGLAPTLNRALLHTGRHGTHAHA